MAAHMQRGAGASVPSLVHTPRPRLQARPRAVETSAAGPVHEAVQDNVEVDRLAAVHQVADDRVDLVAGEAHVRHVIDHLRPRAFARYFYP